MARTVIVDMNTPTPNPTAVPKPELKLLEPSCPLLPLVALLLLGPF
jgi:hypothetical protein